MRARRSVEQVWPRDISDAPVRHPSRSRSAYQPRGQQGLQLAAAWRLDEAARLDRKAHELSQDRDAAKQSALTPDTAQRAAIARSRNIRRAGFAGLPILGLGLALAGNAALQSAPPTPPLQTIATPVAAPPPDAIPAKATGAGTGFAPASSGPPPTRPAPAFQQPDIMDRAPFLPVQPVRMDNPPTIAATLAPQVSGRPDGLTALQPDDPLVCRDCTAPLAPFDGLRFTVHADSTDTAAVRTARSVLSAQAYDVTESRIGVAQTHVRFYRAQDAAAAQALAARYDAALVDLTWFAPGDAPARVDLFMAMPTDDAVTRLTD